MSESKVVKLGDKAGIHSKNIRESSADTHVYCSFCGRANTEVLKMVKGPGVNICSECVMIAIQYLILNDRMPSKEAQNILDMFWGQADKGV